MKTFLVSAALFASSLALAADEPPAQPDPKEKEAMKQLMLEDAKKKAAEAAAKPAGAATTPAEKPDIISKSPAAAAIAAPPAAEPAPPEKPAEKTAADKAATEKSANAKAATEPAAMLPKVEVKKSRVTVLDMQLQQQDKEIAREQKLAKPTELDKALNGSKVSDKLSILGGQSADYRAGVAQERVNMLKDESDLLEAIAHTKDAKEKAELQKELDELRAYRRDLEKSMR